MLLFKLALLFYFSINKCLSQNVSVQPGSLTVVQVPENKDLALALGYTEDSLLNFTELATKYGYPWTQYTVVTNDGYNLALFRLGGKTNVTKKTTPVFMMHGFPDTADTWIISGPDMGPAYLLADLGYDVWLGNTRGNRYSRSHVSLNPNTDVEFWDFTFHQHGTIDVPAMIDYVLNQTGSQQLAYVGHSQGSANFLVLGSTLPNYNDKIKIAALLAPVAWLDNVTSTLVRALAEVQDAIYISFQALGFQELFASRSVAVTIYKLLCQYVPQTVCGNFIYQFSGYESIKYTPSKTVSAIAGHYPAGTSLDNLKRYAQGVKENRFRRFDYGPEKNLVKYGSVNASDYNLGAITAPVGLFCGKQDFLVNLIDAVKIRDALPNLATYTVMSQDDWGHFDFTWSTRVPTDVIPKLVDLFNQYNV